MKGVKLSWFAALTVLLTWGCERNTQTISGYGDLGEAPAQIGDTLYYTTSRYGVEFGVIAIDSKQPQVDWIQPKAGFSPCQNISTDSSALFVSCDAVLSALDPQSGAIQWRVEMSAPLKYRPILLDKRLVVLTEVGDTQATHLGPGHGAVIQPDNEGSRIETAGGEPEAYVWRWMLDMPHPFAWGFMDLEEPHSEAGSPSPSPGEFLPPRLGSKGKKVDFEADTQGDPLEPTPQPTPVPPKGRALILDKQQGRLLTELKGTLHAPLVQFGRALIWQVLTDIVAFSPKDGSILWRYPAPSLALTYVVGGGRLIAVSEDKLLALSPNGEAVWVLETEGRVSPFVSERIVYFLKDRKIHAHALHTGDSLWQEDAPAVIDQPIVYGRSIYLKDITGRIQARDRRTGQLLWSRETKAQGKLRLANNHIYWLDENGLNSLPDDGKGEIATRALPMAIDEGDKGVGFPLDKISAQIIENGVVLRLDDGQIIVVKN